jgi:hypothetical protein
MRGFEGGTEGWLIGFGSGVVVTILVLGGCVSRLTGGGDDPIKDGKGDCETAWMVANDGDEETVNETAILEQPWCIEHLTTKTTMTTMETTP